VESFDGGRSSTQFNTMQTTIYPELAPSRCTAVAITPPVPVPNATGDGKTINLPVALVHAGSGYGSAGDTGALLAKPLVTQTQHDKFQRIGGASNIWQRPCDPLTGGLPSSNYVAIVLHPEDPKHVFVGTENCGLYENTDFTALLETTPKQGSNFTSLSALTVGADLSKAYVNDIVVVPETGCIFLNDNTGKNPKLAGLYEICPLANGSYNATKFLFIGFTGLYGWQVPASRSKPSLVPAPFEQDRDQEHDLGASSSLPEASVTRLVYPTTLTQNGTLLSLDGGSSWQSVLNASTAIGMRAGSGAIPWYNASIHLEHVQFTAGAGDGDTVIVACWVGSNWDKGVGMFKGTIKPAASSGHADAHADAGAGTASVAVSAVSAGAGAYSVEWEDWTGTPQDVSPPGAWPQGTGMPVTYMYDSKSGRGRIVRPDGDKGAAYYYVATQAIGSFRRDIST